MRMTELDRLDAFRVVVDGALYLRLGNTVPINGNTGHAWYAPTASGFELVSGAKADELESISSYISGTLQ